MSWCKRFTTNSSSISILQVMTVSGIDITCSYWFNNDRKQCFFLFTLRIFRLKMGLLCGPFTYSELRTFLNIQIWFYSNTTTSERFGIRTKSILRSESLVEKAPIFSIESQLRQPISLHVYKKHVTFSMS